jgi:hypothetical protein
MTSPSETLMSAPLSKTKAARGPAKPRLPPRITAQSKAPSLLTAALNRYDVDVPGLDAMRHLTLMLLLAPKVPRHYENVARCLRQAYAGKLPQAQRAKRLLEAAGEMLTDPERKAGQYIALMLYEEVLRFSDTPWTGCASSSTPCTSPARKGSRMPTHCRPAFPHASWPRTARGAARVRWNMPAMCVRKPWPKSPAAKEASGVGDCRLRCHRIRAAAGLQPGRQRTGGAAQGCA